MILSNVLQSILAITLIAIAHSGEARTKAYPSPDGILRAVVIPVGKKGYEDQESRIEIHILSGHTLSGKILRWRSFASQDGEHGYGINHGEWTADSQFFIFNADSSGGHQPWRLATFFYRRSANRFYSLENYIGPVTSDFTLERKDEVKTTHFNFEAKNEKEPVTVRLSKLVGRRQ